MKVSDMDKANRLLPCPFCNGNCSYNNTVGDDPDGEVFSSWYECDDCGSRSPTSEVWNTRTGQSPAQCGKKPPISREEFVQLADHLVGDANDPDKALGELYDQLQAQFTAEANAVIAELVEALEAAIAYIGGNSVVGNQFLDLLEATQSRARTYIGKADS